MPSAKSLNRSLFSLILPGILLAATGVGAGDLLTAGLAGSETGTALLWAVLAGALLKWVLTEGLARWQLATGTTLLEGWVWRLGGWIRWVFLTYLALFTLVVGGALATACGVAGGALIPLGDLETSKIVWGVVHSLAGAALVLWGGFRLFEIIMSVCIGIMFVTVLATAVLIEPEWGAVARGFVPSIPEGQAAWVLAVLGGVGGTVTLLSYGYWIREQNRRGREDVRACRIDLFVSQAATALFGLAVILIGSRVTLEGRGAAIALQMADQLASALGPAGKWAFLLGFWGAVFSSLLGVWQSLPYMFADFLELRRAEPGLRRHVDLRGTKAYRWSVVVIATVPLILLGTSVREIQLAYGVLGSLFLPLLALTLLIMNNRRRWVGSDFLSPVWINVLLASALAFFSYVGGSAIWGRLTG